MMAIQFHNSAILFDGTSIAMDPACCCGLSGSCCDWFTETFNIDTTGTPFSASLCPDVADNWVVGNYNVGSTSPCYNDWHETFNISTGSLYFWLRYQGGDAGIHWRLFIYEYDNYGNKVGSFTWGKDSPSTDCVNNGSNQVSLTFLGYLADSGCIDIAFDPIDPIVITAIA